ncbi:XisI protein [Armatimonas sp.]|uniref:XisI protein n=1 Tax=Armatimonas sp. TaxID=1872638 RepID=UPI00374D72EE
MDKLTRYREIIKNELSEFKHDYGKPDVETQLIFDTEHDHYQVISVGWDKKQRVHGIILHVDIRDGKIWIQYNGTESDLGHVFVAAGVPKSDIVLGFQSPFKRQFTEFAVG